MANNSSDAPSPIWEGDSRAYRQADGRITVVLEIRAESAAGGTLDVDVVDLTQPGKRWGNLQCRRLG